MDENLLSLLEELSLRSCSEDDTGNNHFSSYSSTSNNPSPNYDQLARNVTEEDLELKQAVTSLLQELKPSSQGQRLNSNSETCDKSKLLVALLGNTDLVTNAVKKINQLVSIGKRMEQIYRSYYVNPNVNLNLIEVSQLISTFTNVYNSESYVREVNVSRVYLAYCKKLSDICDARMCNQVTHEQMNNDDNMIS